MNFRELLGQKRDELLRCWAGAVRGTHPANLASCAELTDHVPAFIDELVELLEHGENSVPSESAAAHGIQRFRLGFSLASVVREYGILWRCMTDLALGAGVSMTICEQHILSDLVIGGIAEAVSEYGRARDGELLRQSAEHFSFTAHEIRNPLQSASIAVELLRARGQLPQSPIADVLYRSLARMNDLVDRSLELARSGWVVQPQYAPIHVKEMLEDVVGLTAADAQAKRIRTKLLVDGSPTLVADRRLIRSTVSNLVRNAIKFSRLDGEVVVRAGAADEAVLIEVEDACGGLAPEAASRLFQPFIQHDESRGGFGLGLAIAKHAIEAHRGSIVLTNVPGKGCKFAFTLPSKPDHSHA